MNQRLGDGPVTEEYRDKMRAIMETLDEFMNGGAKGRDRKVGIVVLTFAYNEVGNNRCNFMSNGADRKDLVVLMKEMIARFEGQPEVRGHA